MQKNLKIKLTIFKSNFATSEGGKSHFDNRIVRHYKFLQNNPGVNSIQTSYIWGSKCEK